MASNVPPIISLNAIPQLQSQLTTGLAQLRLLQASILSKLGLTGGTLTGPLILARDPQQPKEAATKGYVDNNPAISAVTQLPPPSPLSRGKLYQVRIGGEDDKLYVGVQKADGSDGFFLISAS